MDTESPVIIWPSWCYNTTGDPPSIDSSTTTISVTQTKTRNNKRRMERHLTTNTSTTPTTINTTTNNNNNSIKNERLTPPITTATTDLIDNTAPSTLNYSDWMRHLAARYNTTSTNDGSRKSTEMSPSPPITITPSPTTTVATAASSFDMSTTQTLLALMRTAKEAELQRLLLMKRHDVITSPLDLSVTNTTPTTILPTLTAQSQPPPTKKLRPNRTGSPTVPALSPKDDLINWTIDDVCNFVGSIDICAEYVQTFRDQRIDGAGLPLLTDELLITKMNMKLGPALKLRALLAKRFGITCLNCLHCTKHCHLIRHQLCNERERDRDISLNGVGSSATSAPSDGSNGSGAGNGGANENNT